MLPEKIFEDCIKVTNTLTDAHSHLNEFGKKKSKDQSIAFNTHNKDPIAEELLKLYNIVGNAVSTLRKVFEGNEKSPSLRTVYDNVKAKRDDLHNENMLLVAANDDLRAKTDKWVEYSNVVSKVEELFDGWKGQIQEEIGLESQVKQCVKQNLKAVVKEAVDIVVDTQDFKKTFSDAVKGSKKAIKIEAEKSFKTSLTQALKENQTEILEQTVTRYDADQFEKEKRCRNIVINNITESSAQNINERIKADTQFVSSLLDISETKIERCFRAGPPLGTGTNKDRISPRPLIIILESPELARHYHKYGNGSKIIYEGNDYWINPDLTRAERRANYHARQLRRNHPTSDHSRMPSEN